ncbi:hypothetical protein ID866_12003, partial [Astraeus odoratus]
MAARTAERRRKCEEEEQREEEEKAWRAEEAKWRAEEVTRAAEVQRRTVEGQRKPSVVIPMGGVLVVRLRGPGLHVTGVRIGDPHSGAKASCSWLKAAGGVTQKRRRTEAKEDDGEDDEGDNEDDSEGDFTVPPALVQEHRDVLGALTMTLSTLLKEFKGYRHEQWDLHTRQVKGLKALQREMRKANALKAKELEVTTKGKEKATEVMEESSVKSGLLWTSSK